MSFVFKDFRWHYNKDNIIRNSILLLRTPHHNISFFWISKQPFTMVYWKWDGKKLVEDKRCKYIINILQLIRKPHKTRSISLNVWMGFARVLSRESAFGCTLTLKDKYYIPYSLSLPRLPFVYRFPILMTALL